MIKRVRGFLFVVIKKIKKYFIFWEPFYKYWYLMRDKDYLWSILQER